jgi:hypothetical protein
LPFHGPYNEHLVNTTPAQQNDDAQIHAIFVLPLVLKIRPLKKLALASVNQ